ncbi:MAG: tetratricopeptide repeat protein [Solirubrobacterales bacterium]
MTHKQDDAAADLLIKEVDEELRQDQMKDLWSRHGNAIMAAAVSLVVAVAGWQGWTAWQTTQRQEASRGYQAAMRLVEQGKRDEAFQSLSKIATDGASGYRVLADLQRAQVKQQAGDTAAAVGIYEAIAAGSADAPYRDLARLKAAYLKLDSGDAGQIAKSVEPLAAESSPWRHSAREVIAVAALKTGDDAKATELFRKLADDAAAPQGVRARAAEMLAALGGKAKG